MAETRMQWPEEETKALLVQPLLLALLGVVVVLVVVAQTHGPWCRCPWGLYPLRPLVIVFQQGSMNLK